MARVLLVKCRLLNRRNRTVVPPIGVMYIASVLRNEGHQVQILETATTILDESTLDKLMGEFKPDVVGISAIVPEYSSLKALMKLVVKVAPGIPVVVGGPMASSDPEATLALEGVSVIVPGEGEITMKELVPVLTARQDPLTVPGTAVMKDGTVLYASPRELMSPEQLDALPFPAWDLIDIESYSHVRSMASVGTRRYMQIFTSRGCPFHCVYCHNIMGKGFRPRSPESVLAEFRELRDRYDIHEFEIIDDCFNLDRERMVTIVEGLMAMNDPELRLQFSNGLRADLLTEDDIRLLRQVGTNFIGFAIETASPVLQKSIHKNLNIDRVVQAISSASKAGIFCSGFFMIGFPGETEAEAMETINLAASTQLHMAQFFIVTAYKGTALYATAGHILNERFGNVALDDLNFFKINHNLSQIDDGELKKLFSLAYRKFYLNPIRILRILATHPRKSQIPMYGVQFINMSFGSLLERMGIDDGQ